jgi:hypothetical protein
MGALFRDRHDPDIGGNDLLRFLLNGKEPGCVEGRPGYLSSFPAAEK